MSTKQKLNRDSLAIRIGDLSARKQQFLDKLLKNDGVDLSRFTIIPQKRDGEPLPLSFAQNRLWFLHQLDPANMAYNIPLAVRMMGNLHAGALERSLNEIIRRHEVLRTCFAAQKGLPVQVILPEMALPLTVIDLKQFPAAEREEEVTRLAAEYVTLPFDLASGPLLRTLLLRAGEDHHVLVLIMHHIVCDGWSVGVLIRELASLYEAYLTGKPSSLPDLRIQYADYSYWQREWMQGEVLEKQLGYWRELLKGASSLMQLPTDRPRPSAPSFLGERQRFQLDETLSEQLTALNQREGVTLFMSLLAAFVVLLYRYSGEEDILVGTPSANRNRSEVEDLIGFFINTLVFRTDLGGEPSYGELLKRVKATALGAYAHQDLPFEKLVEELQPERSFSHAPLFQVMFALQNAPVEALQLPGLTMNEVWIKTTMATYDLTLVAIEVGGKIGGFIEYSKDLFDNSTIVRMTAHYENLLRSITEDCTRKVSELSLLTGQETEQILHEWAGAAKEYPQDKSIHELIEAQAERTPDATALAAEGQQITYAELNRRANQLARYLRECGVGPEVLVGICINRGIEMVIGLLGILKAGGAFLPLDPTYPEDRLAFMLADARAEVLLINKETEQKLPTQNMKVVRLDADAPHISRLCDENLQSVDARNLAYVIYTSGSTGRPKGVLIEHKGVCNMAEAQVRRFKVSSDSRVLQFSPLSFDASVFEIVMALRAGATLYLCKQEKLTPGAGLHELMKEEAITHITIPPSILGLLKGEEELNALSTIVVAGEACSAEVADRWSKGRKFYNAYGPTEATVWATTDDCRQRNGRPAIGQAIDNAHVYLLDSNLQLVPVGVKGEIYIAGPGIARGYLNRPEQTAEKFIPDSFNREAGARLYKTGDLARYKVDGRIEYLGRVDQQVKVRGVRIELGEIEEVIRQEPAIKDVIVDVQEVERGASRLIAYVLPEHGADVRPGELKAALRVKLPEFMVPQFIVKLERLPLTTSGKVDRRALSVMAPDNAEDQSYEAARTLVEEMLAGIWAEVLCAERVGVHNNFFDLGGHSLLAMQVISRARDAFNVEIPLRAIFESLTVAALAERVEALLRANDSPRSRPLEPVSRESNLPLSFAQQRLWFINQLMPDSPLYNMPIAVRLEGALNVAALEQSLTEITRRHEVLRTTFKTVNGQPAQVISAAKPLAVPVVYLNDGEDDRKQAEVRRLVDEEMRRAFNLERGPLIRATLLRLSEREQILLMTMHHIVSDGWSVGVLVEEVASLYERFCTGKPSSLPELRINYADYAEWQRQYLQGEIFEAQLSYWKRQLGGIPATLQLPTDRPRPTVQTFRGASYTHTLPVALSDSLKELSRREGCTLFMTLLAGFSALLYRYTGQQDILVGTPVAARPQLEAEKVIGFFTNTLVLRTNLSGDPTLRDLLKRVREVCLGAYAHQDLPFEKLVETLHPDRDLSRTPIVQVALALQNAPMPPLKLPNLTLSLLDADTKTAKTDLSLSMIDADQGLTASMEYSTDLFDAATVAKMMADYQALLESVIANPDQHLSALPAPSVQQVINSGRIDSDKDAYEAIYERSNLTKNQILVWLGQMLLPEAPLYNNAFSFGILDGINPLHFQRAFQTLINSCDSMRTAVRVIDGVPQRRVLDTFQFSLEYLDFSHLPDPVAEYRAWGRKRCEIQFDLEKCLFDSALVKINENRYGWYLNQHHLISDGYSYMLILRHMSELYERSLRGELEDSIALPSYESYVEYERAHRNSAQYLRAEKYWEGKLEKPSEPLVFYGRNHVKQTTRIRRVACRLGEQRAEKLKEVARREGIFNRHIDLTMLNIFSTVLFTYLHRVSGNQEQTIATPYHNRRSASVKETIGLVMQIVLLKVTIDEKETFLSLSKKVSSDIFNSMRNCPFALGNPLNKKAYDVFLNYHNENMAVFRGKPVIPEWFHTEHETDSLGLQIRDFGLSGNLALDFDFHCDVFDEEEQARAINHFLKVLDAFLEDPAQPLLHLNLLTAEERQEILCEFNRTCKPFARDWTITDLFQAQVEKTPDRVAVTFEGHSLTYAQLNERANRLAHRLRSLGIGPEALVAICVERSLDMHLGLLAILKAGGAYVPLDPAYPRERLNLILEDARAFVLLTQSHLKDRFAGYSQKIICLDVESFAAESTENPATVTDPNNVAYVIYTSGSTGRPKGVMVSHYNLLNIHAVYEGCYSLGPDPANHLQVASLSFDVATGDWVRALCLGGRLVMCSQEALLTPAQLQRLIGDEAIEYVEMTPAFSNSFMSYLKQTGQALDGLRRLVIGADAYHFRDFNEARRVFGPRTQIVNSYGVTEATIDSTIFTGSEVALPADGIVPIGRPIPNTRIYVLDAGMQPVPKGVVGELYIGGEGITRGYLEQPALTAERFVPDLFADRSGARLYKTGDLARYLLDGNIEFLGRSDNQVKVRGFRVELGEIEASLNQHPAVREALVIADGSGTEEKRLAAYLVPSQSAPSVEELSRFLSRKLPAYMVPSMFIMLEAMPISPNGKLDRKSLPDLSNYRPELCVNYAPPQTEVERAIASVWQAVLRIDKVGLHDNFFDLGGHSLLIVQAHSRLREQYKWNISILDMFKHPTVSSLAKYVSGASDQQPSLQQSYGRAEARIQSRKRRRGSRQMAETP
ncbi:MAG: amino acid adenylation domain-containing protein [Blastocatellia bacterium]